MGCFDGYFLFDYMSFSLVFVSFFVFLCTIFFFSSFFSYLLFLFIFFLIFLSFLTVSMVLFYSFFEFVFIVMFYFLINWGKSFERIQASFYMFFFTMVFSMPFLMVLSDFGLLHSFFFFFVISFNYSSFFWFSIFVVFMVKLPVFGLHIWLPKAHVEAPVSGSMLLAGVLLKLGGYGLYRFFFLLKDLTFSYYFLTIIFFLGLWGGMLSCLICIRTSDMKMLIAYSSVVHMSSMLLGLLSFSFMGSFGGVLMMVSHGFISPLLFFLFNMLYWVMSSRSILFLKGFFFLNSTFFLVWFFACFLNLGLPPFMSFFSEVFVFGSLGFLCFLEWLVVFFILFFSGVYSVFLFLVPYHGVSLFFFSFYFFSMDLLLSLLISYFVLVFPFFYFIPLF